MFTLIVWLEFSFLSSLHCKLTVSSLALPCLEGYQYAEPTLKEGELRSTSLRAERLSKLPGTLRHRRFVYSASLNSWEDQSFIYLNTYIRMDSWRFTLHFGLQSNTLLQLETLKTLCKWKKPDAKDIHTVWFRSYKMSRIRRSIETETTSVLSRPTGGETGNWLLVGSHFTGDENVLKLQQCAGCTTLEIY